MKTVPTIYLPSVDMFIRLGDLIVWNMDSDEPAGIAGHHDVLKITGIQLFERVRINNVVLDWECIDCGDTSGWTGKRNILASCIRPLTPLEYKRVMKDIGVDE